MKLFIAVKNMKSMGMVLSMVAKSFGIEMTESAEEADLIIGEDPHQLRDLLMANPRAKGIEYHISEKENPSRLCETGHPLEGRVVPGFVLTYNGDHCLIIEVIKRLATA